MLEEELRKWKRFQDILRIDDREIFEDMMDECRRHASEAGNLASPSKTEAMILSILFAHHKALKQLQEKIDQLTTSTDSVKRD
jgi:hypothetical protein